MNKMMEAINNLGIDKTAELLAEYLNQKISSEDIAIQFILEEIEAASQGNEIAKLFAIYSGFDEEDYKGAMCNSFEKIDGENGLQQEISNFCIMLYSNQELMTELRIKIVDNIMKYWELGKYARINNSTLINIVKKVNDLQEGIFANINNDLNETFTNFEYRIEKLTYIEKLNYMAYAYARRTVAAGLVLQGVFDLKDFKHVQKFFESIQVQTIHTKDFQEKAAYYADKYILSYDNRLNINFLNYILMTVYKFPENFKVNKDNGIYYTYEEILKSLSS